MCASNPFATETTIGSGGRGLLMMTFVMKRSLTTVLKAVTSNRVVPEVHSAPASNDVLRSGFRSGFPWLICVRPPTMVVVKPVSIDASGGNERAPDGEVSAQVRDQLVLDPEAGIEDGERAV